MISIKENMSEKISKTKIITNSAILVTCNLKCKN